MLISRFFILFTISFILVGCQDTGHLQEENAKLKLKIELLEKELESYKKTVESLSKKLVDVQDGNKILEKERNEIANKQREVSKFDIFKERFLVVSGVLSYETITIKKLKELLGEPNEITSGPAAHGSGQDIVLHYDKATFFFRTHNEKELIKSFKIKEPVFITSQGITVGSTKEEVIHAYGHDLYEENDHHISMGGKTGMSFELKEGIVTEILVWYQYE